MPRVTGEKTRQAILVTGPGPDVIFPPEHLELYKPNGDPIDPSGAGGGGVSSAIPFQHSVIQEVPNDGVNVTYSTALGPPPVITPIPFPEVVVGTYLFKIHVFWNVIDLPVTSGDVSITLLVDTAPEESYATEYELYMTGSEVERGWKQHMDLAIVPDPGTFRLVAWQVTDQAILPLETRMWLVHL